MEPTSTLPAADVTAAEQLAPAPDALKEAIRDYAATRSCSSQVSCWVNPQPDGETRFAIGGSGAHDLWFAGNGDALHFDGATLRAHATKLASTFALWSSSADELWAVGEGGIARWNGKTFSLHRASPGLEYRSVWGASPNDVYAVGQHELVHWDGRAWTVVPGITGTQVSGSGADNVWVGGVDLWHFDGHAWTPVSGGPARPVVTLSVLGRDDVWAAGKSLAEDLRHFDGQSWTTHTISDGLFTRGVVANGPRDRWLLGNDYAGAKLNYFDGTKWTAASVQTQLFALRTVGDQAYAVGASGRILRLVPGTPPSFEDLTTGSTAKLNRTWGTSRTNMWAVGDNGTALRFDGARTHQTTTGAWAKLLALSGTSPDDVWAVGTGGTILNWNGTQWKNITTNTIQELRAVYSGTPGVAWTVSPFELLRVSNGRVERFVLSGAPSSETYTYDVDGTAVDDVWVVGRYGNNANRVGFVSHFDGRVWSTMRALRNGSVSRDLTRVRARARDDVWATTTPGATAADDYVWHWDGKDWTALWLNPSADKPAAADARPWNPPRFDDFQLGNERWTVGANGAWRRWQR